MTLRELFQKRLEDMILLFAEDLAKSELTEDEAAGLASFLFVLQYRLSNTADELVKEFKSNGR